MPVNKRLKIFEAINGSSIHQSITTSASQNAISRCQSNHLRDPGQTLETLRSLLQPEINQRIQRVLKEICESHFKPALRNLKLNLGEENVPVTALDDVCMSVLEAAKEIYSTKADSKRQSRGKCPNQVLKRSFSGTSSASPPIKKSMVIKSGLGRPNTDLILVNKAGRPVRREGPKWEPERLNTETLFILGSRANKALGFGQTRGRLYIKHPELFKYSGDQTDKEWLAKANLMATTGGKAYLMVLRDILDLAESPDYNSHPKQQPGELVGFTVPEWMIEKMKTYIENAKTNPETTDEELLRIAEEYAEMDEEGRKVRRDETNLDDKRGRKEEELSLDRLMCEAEAGAQLMCEAEAGPNVAQFLNEIKHETVDDDLENLDPGFLQGMNLHNLVREFEMETGGGAELNLLALADDSLHNLQ